MTTPPDPRAARETAAAALRPLPSLPRSMSDEQAVRILSEQRVQQLHALAALVTALADEVERLGALLAASDGEAQP